MSKTFRTLFIFLFPFALASCGGSDQAESSAALTAASTTLKAASGPRWKAIELGTLGGNNSGANGINAYGAVVGWSDPALSDMPRGFLYRNGTMTDTGSLGGAISTQAQAINRSGTIVGTSYIDVGRPRAFVAANGQLRDIGDLGGGTSVANGINDKGQIVGSSGVGVVNGNTVSHAFLYSDGRMQDLGTIGADPVSTATGINRRGQVVGYTYDPATGGQRAFIYQNGKMTDLSSLGAYAAYAINDDGTVVGDGNGGGFIYSSSNGSISFIPGFSPRAINSKGTIVGAGFFGGSAAIYENGTLSDLNAGSLVDRPAGIDKLGQALGINDNGEIVGAARFFDANGVGATRAFLLVPTAQK